MRDAKKARYPFPLFNLLEFRNLCLFGFIHGVANAVFISIALFSLIGKLKVTVWQLPLVCAWALTIHKAQGLSLDKAAVSLNAFAYGQSYVAASRARTLEGLTILTMDPKKIRASPQVTEYYESLKPSS